MSKNFLIITEGAKTEPVIFTAILEKYGFNVIKQDQIKIQQDTKAFDFDVTELVDNNDNVFIAQSPKKQN